MLATRATLALYILYTLNTTLGQFLSTTPTNTNYAAETSTNVAFMKSTKQSSTYGNKYSSYAVDGNPSTCSIAGKGSGSVEQAWWQIDLEAFYVVDHVTIINTQDQYESMYLRNFEIYVGSTNSTVKDSTNYLCYSFTTNSNPGQLLTLSCPSKPPTMGRFLTLRRLGGFRQDALSLCEVAVFPVADSNFNHNKTLVATDLLSTIETVKLDPSFASQSRTFATHGAWMAVDSNPSTCSIAGIGSESSEFGWWMIDLGTTRQIAVVEILNNANIYESKFLNNFDIYVGSSPDQQIQKCATFSQAAPVLMGVRVNLTCTPGPVAGRYVTAKRFGGFRQDAISFCEVNIYALPIIGSNSSKELTNVSPPLISVAPKSWRQSSVFGNSRAQLAFDGGPETCFVIGEGSGSSNYAWFVIDLSTEYQLYSITLINSPDSYEAQFMNQLEISVTRNDTSDARSICYSSGQNFAVDPGVEMTLVCTSNTSVGRFVTLRRLGGFRQDALAICEMKILVVSSDLQNNTKTTINTFSQPTTVTTASSSASTTILPLSFTTTTTTTTTTIIITAATTKTTSFWTTKLITNSTTTSTQTQRTSPSLLTYSTQVYVCPTDYFICADGSGCIQNSYRCDFYPDCRDGSDELNCPCDLKKKFRCANTKCIDIDWICDKTDDCGDGSDEYGCSCLNDEFFCDNQKCVKIAERCNGYDNCGDGSDELACDQCLPKQFRCDDGECIMTTYRCDGTIHCSDASDERNCPCTDGYVCQMTGICINQNVICDRVRDCPDNSDEINCTCLPYQFRCLNGACLHNDFRCDGVKDCPLGDDENPTLCPKCRSDEFMCSPKNGCITLQERCNGIVNCPDGGDELNCLTLDNSTASSSTPLTKLLVLTMNGEAGNYVCADGWNDDWSASACNYMGLGPPEGTSLEKVPPTLTKFAVVNASRSNDLQIPFTRYFIKRLACPSNQIVSLKCSAPICGTRAQLQTDFGPYLVNGDVAAIGAWPWHVQIFVNDNFVCGGSLINSRWILTAAHCFYIKSSSNQQTTQPAANVYIRMGTNILDRAIRSYNDSITADSKNTSIQNSRVDKIILHPTYDDVNVDYDYSLVKLTQAVTYSDLVRPICLAQSDPSGTSVPSYKVCMAIGFGKTLYSAPLSKFLLQGRMNIMDYETCIRNINEGVGMDKNRANSSINRKTMLCAGSYPTINSVNTCHGDSGSPLACRDAKDIWYIQGISSFSINNFYTYCANSVYSKVETAVDWIKRTMSLIS